jgi:hypothetical protein
VKSLNCNGIFPVSKLLATLKMFNVLTLESDDVELNKASREPVSWLLPRSACCRVVILNSPAGRAPVKLFSLTLNFSIMENAETHAGMGPLKLLLERSTFSIYSLSKHISAGTKPASPLAATVQKIHQQ